MILVRLSCIVIFCRIAIVSAQDDPTSVACTILSSSSIQLTWTQPTNTAVNGYHLAVERIDGISGSGIPNIVLSSYTYVSYTYSGLGNYAQYNMTIHSYIGGSNYTDVSVTCRTSEDAPNGAPLNFNCTAISEYEITCVWDALEQAYWNGILTGYRLQWLGENVSEMYSANVSDTVYTYSTTSLARDARYIFLLCGFTSVNYGTVYATDVETTLGAVTKEVENVTRYYCNEALPGMIEFSWDEMPCTIYTGSIAGLLLLCLLLFTIMGCQSCCQKTGPGVEISMIGGPSRVSGRDSKLSHASRDDDESSANETDTEDVFEEGLSDNEDREGGDSVKPNSAIIRTSVTPSDSEFGDRTKDSTDGYSTRNSDMDQVHGELSDSDYSSDLDEQRNTRNKGKGKAKYVHRDIKLKTPSKTNKSFHSMTITAAGIRTSDASKGTKAETPDIYEDWNPDYVAYSDGLNITDGDDINSGGGEHGKYKRKHVTSLSDSHEHLNKKSTNTSVMIHNNAQPLSDWDEDGPIERTASVSSILVDTNENVFDSVWSPDITVSSKPVDQPVHSSVFIGKPFAERRALQSAGISNLVQGNGKETETSPTHLQASMHQLAPTDNTKEIFVNIGNVGLAENLSLNGHGDTLKQKDPSRIVNVKHASLIKNNKSKGKVTCTAPAWLSKRQRDELRKANNVTPIQEVNITQDSVLVDIEPVLETDRLGKKFPFLSLDIIEKDGENDKSPIATNAWSRPMKVSNVSKLKKSMPNTQITETRIVLPDQTTLEDGSDATKPVSKETKVQIFYGFGVGRFRKMASNWLSRMKMKRSNVKLVNSKWD